MIHANSGTMRQWLWRDLLHNVDMYNSNYFVLHMFGCTIGIFILAVFETGVVVGKIVGEIERLDRKHEDEEHMNTSKNNRQWFS